MTNDRPSPLPKILLGLCLGMLVICAIIVMHEQPDGNRGQPHRIYPATMLEGGPGVERLGDVRWLGLAFALCQVGVYVCSLLMGIHRTRGRTLVMVIVGLLYAAAFVALTVVDLSYARGDTRQIVGGFPVSTAIMVYAVGGIPTLFIILYCLLFDHWVLTDNDAARIEELAARYQSQQDDRAVRESRS